MSNLCVCHIDNECVWCEQGNEIKRLRVAVERMYEIEAQWLKSLDEKLYIFRRELALGHIDMSILNDIARIHALVIKQSEQVEQQRQAIGENLNDWLG